MAHDPKTLQTILIQAARPDLDLAFRPMFGGIMGYCAGNVFASLSDVGLALKLFGADRETLLAKDGAKPLRYGEGQPASKSYVVIPDAMLSNHDELGAWLERCAAGLKPKSKRTRS